MNDRILEELQTRIAYLERALNDLGDLVFRQHQDIQALERQLGELGARLGATTQGSEPQRSPEDERPPHY